jgi:hypothetical protein
MTTEGNFERPVEGYGVPRPPDEPKSVADPVVCGYLQELSAAEGVEFTSGMTQLYNTYAELCLSVENQDLLESYFLDGVPVTELARKHDLAELAVHDVVRELTMQIGKSKQFS